MRANVDLVSLAIEVAGCPGSFRLAFDFSNKQPAIALIFNPREGTKIDTRLVFVCVLIS